MKKIFLLVTLTAVAGCTTYPKQYTYSPTVTINGDSDVTLPSPYSKHKRVYEERSIERYIASMPPRTYDVEPNRFYYDPTTGELYDSRE